MLDYNRIMNELSKVDPEMYRWLLEVEPSRVNLNEVQEYLRIINKNTPS